jgi:hypothetical protein
MCDREHILRHPGPVVLGLLLLLGCFPQRFPAIEPVEDLVPFGTQVGYRL